MGGVGGEGGWMGGVGEGGGFATVRRRLRLLPSDWPTGVAEGWPWERRRLFFLFSFFHMQMAQCDNKHLTRGSAAPPG